METNTVIPILAGLCAVGLMIVGLIGVRPINKRTVPLEMIPIWFTAIGLTRATLGYLDCVRLPLAAEIPSTPNWSHLELPWAT